MRLSLILSLWLRYYGGLCVWIVLVNTFNIGIHGFNYFSLWVHLIFIYNPVVQIFSCIPNIHYNPSFAAFTGTLLKEVSDCDDYRALNYREGDML